MRIAASWCQPLQLSLLPVGAFIRGLICVLICLGFPIIIVQGRRLD
jgi:hypothetical protein